MLRTSGSIPADESDLDKYLEEDSGAEESWEYGEEGSWETEFESEEETGPHLSVLSEDKSRLLSIEPGVDALKRASLDSDSAEVSGEYEDEDEFVSSEEDSSEFPDDEEEADKAQPFAKPAAPPKLLLTQVQKPAHVLQMPPNTKPLLSGITLPQASSSPAGGFFGTHRSKHEAPYSLPAIESTKFYNLFSPVSSIKQATGFSFSSLYSTDGLKSAIDDCLQIPLTPVNFPEISTPTTYQCDSTGIEVAIEIQDNHSIQYTIPSTPQKNEASTTFAIEEIIPDDDETEARIKTTVVVTILMALLNSQSGDKFEVGECQYKALAETVISLFNPNEPLVELTENNEDYNFLTNLFNQGLIVGHEEIKSGSSINNACDSFVELYISLHENVRPTRAPTFMT